MLDPSTKRFRYERDDREEREAMGVSAASTLSRVLAVGLRIEDLLIEIRDQNALLIEHATKPDEIDSPKRGRTTRAA